MVRAPALRENGAVISASTFRPRLSPLAPWAVALAVVAVYGTLSWDSGFLYDDQRLIEDETRPNSAGDLLRTFAEPHYGALPYYRPLTRASYLAQKALSGDDPRPYHMVNALLAGTVALATWLLLRSPPLGTARIPTALGAAVFALHPATGACALPIAGRDSLLPLLFVLLSVAGHLRPTPAWRAVSWSSFLAALFSKELAVATPLILVAADVAFAQLRPATIRSWAQRYLPFVAALVIYAAARAVVLVGQAPDLAVLDRPLGPFESLLFGLQTTLAPAISLVYEPPSSGWLDPVRMATALIVATAIRWATLGLPRPVLAFWGAWFVILQLPSANLFVQETLFDERYVFPATLAAPAILAAAASGATRARAVIVAALIGAALAFVLMQAHRAPIYANPRGFHERWATTNPTSASARNGLGTLQFRDGQVESAIASFETSLRLRPDDAQALNNLGSALVATNRSTEAVSMLRRAVALHPAFAKAWYNLGNALAATDRLPESEAAYREALRLRPAYAQAWNNIAAVLVRLDRTDEALAALTELQRYEPQQARAGLNYGILLARGNRLPEAMAAYEGVIELEPDNPDAHFNLAAVLERLGRIAQAHAHYEAALRLRPGWPLAATGYARTAPPG